MPTYEFRCPDGTIVEKFFKISEVPETIPSPNGDGDAVRMITGGAGLVFKGSGFYITDYGKDGKKDQRDASSKREAAKTSDDGGAAKGGEPSKADAGATAAASPAKASGSSDASSTGSASSTPKPPKPPKTD